MPRSVARSPARARSDESTMDTPTSALRYALIASVTVSPGRASAAENAASRVSRDWIATGMRRRSQAISLPGLRR